MQKFFSGFYYKCLSQELLLAHAAFLNHLMTVLYRLLDPSLDLHRNQFPMLRFLCLHRLAQSTIRKAANPIAIKIFHRRPLKKPVNVVYFNCIYLI